MLASHQGEEACVLPQPKTKALLALSGIQGFGYNSTLISVMIAGLRSIKRMCFLHGCEIMFLHLESIGRSHIRGIHMWLEWGCVQLCGNVCSCMGMCSSMGMHPALQECMQLHGNACSPGGMHAALASSEVPGVSVIRSVWAECLLPLAALQLFHGALSQCFQQ